MTIFDARAPSFVARLPMFVTRVSVLVAATEVARAGVRHESDGDEVTHDGARHARAERQHGDDGNGVGDGWLDVKADQ